MTPRIPPVPSALSSLLTPSPITPMPRLHRRTPPAPRSLRAHHSTARNARPEPPSAAAPAAPCPPKNWLSEVRRRVGRCIAWGGLAPAQLERAAAILQVVAEDWRDLVAGSQGFLTGRGREGLFRQEVVWGETDSMGHVNNVYYNRYAESARVKWVHNYATYLDPRNREEWRKLCTPSDIGLILKSIETQFKFPMTWPDRITVYHRLLTDPADTGRADAGQFSLKALILSEKHRRASAECTEELVIYDYGQGARTCMKPFMLDAFAKTWEEQETAKKKNIARVEALLAQVAELERGTWDRPDAVEDFGRAVEP